MFDTFRNHYLNWTHLDSHGFIVVGLELSSGVFTSKNESSGGVNSENIT